MEEEIIDTVAIVIEHRNYWMEFEYQWKIPEEKRDQVINALNEILGSPFITEGPE